jgi:lysophospholipase L1-like esterase
MARWLIFFIAAGLGAQTFHFDFAAGEPPVYSDSAGFGLEQGSSVAKAPFYFSWKATAEGNYRVTVTLGDPTAETVTTVKAELRRLMLERVRTKPGETVQRTFLVNVRWPEIAGGGVVRLKDREKNMEAWAWDHKLTLEFTDSHPGVRAIDIAKADDVPTLFIVGDSTSTDQPREPFNSWGQMLTRFFEPRIAVANHGESGESLRGFVSERRWDKVMSVIRRGDWMLIQMGHNDQKERGEGVGAFTTYQSSLERMIAEAKAHGATPVLVTPMNRLTFDDAGKITNSLGDYPEAVRRAAEKTGTAVIDLNAMSKPFYEAMGPVDGHRAFAGKDTTHHSDYGSYELAKCIAQALRDQKIGLANYLVKMAAFDPAHPDAFEKFDVPAEPLTTVVRPLGDTATVFVVGDSTASNTENRGWGDHLQAQLDPVKFRVANRARAGRSSRTFVTEGLWDKVRDDLKPGDLVLIQFGHNDGGPIDTDRARGSLPGVGEETQGDVHTFGWYLRKMIAETKAKGATPIVLSTTVRNIWKDGKVERGPGHFGEWEAEVARAEGVKFADVTKAIADRYEQLGEEKVKAFFPQDHTHTSAEGAELNASIVASTVPGLKPTLWLIGDSTVRNGKGDGGNGQWGWGEPLVDLFDPAKVTVANKALGGTSSRTFLTQGLWDRVLAQLQPGDFVMMQFGHNDSGPLDDKARARGTLPGVGEETREIENPITGKHETVHTYGWYLSKFVQDAQAKGATPMVCSLVPRKIWKDGKIVRSKDSYAQWAAQVAKARGVAFVDLNSLIADRYDAMGQEQVEALFADEHTHTSRAGAELNAKVVADAVKALAGSSLAGYLK